MKVVTDGKSFSFSTEWPISGAGPIMGGDWQRVYSYLLKLTLSRWPTGSREMIAVLMPISSIVFLSPILRSRKSRFPGPRRSVKNRNHNATCRTIRNDKVASPGELPNSESPSSFLDRLFRGRTGSNGVYALLLSTYASKEIQLR